MSPLEDENSKRLNRFVAKLAAKLRQMELNRRSGELILTLGVTNGGICRWTVETTEGGRANDE